ncbi:hypothetical protein CAPTEDRAFT_20914 [Capitella teleta]|uniref:Uncharacterized protein n=1 Tax=Capitella teleta TaxID=283909 RepID=R7U2C6_CAPTE|nr:hypothetical protein CAPTEDRAFT_20914 [Capitella teleta]|eukprot:ELU00490.1 hypothetical protein CAPTEDRAFT_20914 [Capitella teleta]
MAAVNSYNEAPSARNFTRSSSGEGHVGFKEPQECTQEREKYLTAKYPKKTMHLIRKRIAVEYYLDEELRRLYGVNEDDTYDCEIDIDELLDIDEEVDRRHFLQSKVANSRQSQEVVDKFIIGLLAKANTL